VCCACVGGGGVVEAMEGGIHVMEAPQSCAYEASDVLGGGR
jgi:hypothetical protein